MITFMYYFNWAFPLKTTYVKDRTQFVEITQIERSNFTQNRYLSSLREILHGVPQGLILGLLLFLLYINDLQLKIQWVKLVLFADDTNILVADKDEDVLQHKILSIMKQLEIWLQTNDLIINTDKTFAMSFHSNQCRLLFKPQIMFKTLKLLVVQNCGA
jgi:hypothetical protein